MTQKGPVYAFTGAVKKVRIGPLHQAQPREPMQKTSTRDRSILQILQKEKVVCDIG